MDSPEAARQLLGSSPCPPARSPHSLIVILSWHTKQVAHAGQRAMYLIPGGFVAAVLTAALVVEASATAAVHVITALDALHQHAARGAGLSLV